MYSMHRPPATATPASAVAAPAAFAQLLCQPAACQSPWSRADIET